MAELKCKNLCVNYGKLCALSNVNFEVIRGDYLSIVGENGSGKSTLIKSLLGLCAIQNGEIAYDDGVRQNLGYLPQRKTISAGFPASVREVVISGIKSKGIFYKKDEKKIAIDCMKKLKIDDLANKSYQSLSGGQQQRVLLSRALCSLPVILFLDEPEAGLDPYFKDELHYYLKKINKDDGTTIVMASHDLRGAINNANKILHLDKEVKFFGSTENYLISNASNRFIGVKT